MFDLVQFLDTYKADICFVALLVIFIACLIKEMR